MKTDQMGRAKVIDIFTACCTGTSASHLHFSRNTIASRGMGRVYSRGKTRLQVCPDWRLLAWGSCTGSYESGASCVIG